MRYIQAPIIPLLALLLVASSCTQDTDTGERKYAELRGETMGTTYTIRYYSFDRTVKLKDSIRTYLEDINDALSTYIPTSHISKFNQTGLLRFPVDRDGRTLERKDGYFMSNIYEAISIHTVSKGAFDPTVGPLVNVWGFGWEGKQPEAPDSARILALKQRVGMQYVEVDRIGDTLEVRRTRDSVLLDLSAIAKGFGVDMLAHLLETQSIFDYYVEIGGELRVAGESPRGGPWILGINVPKADASVTEVYDRVALQTAAMATSGNYRNYYEVDGQRVWHSINPRTGYPEANNLLSATIIHPQCMTADALATACMIMGVQDAITMIEAFKDAECYLIFENNNGQMTAAMSSGFDKLLVGE